MKNKKMFLCVCFTKNKKGFLSISNNSILIYADDVDHALNQARKINKNYIGSMPIKNNDIGTLLYYRYYEKYKKLYIK